MILIFHILGHNATLSMLRNIFTFSGRDIGMEKKVSYYYPSRFPFGGKKLTANHFAGIGVGIESDR